MVESPSRTNVLSRLLISETVGGTPSKMGMAGSVCDCGPCKIPLPPSGALIGGSQEWEDCSPGEIRVELQRVESNLGDPEEIAIEDGPIEVGISRVVRSWGSLMAA